MHVLARDCVRPHNRGLPVLGDCYGFQLLAHMQGLRVSALPASIREFRHVDGVGRVYFHRGNALDMCVFSDHMIGTQFHPESTSDGQTWLKQWITKK